MKVEMFYTLGCSGCGAQHDELRVAAQAAVKDLEWRDINVLDNVDRAVEIAFTSMPTATQLRKALIERSGGRT